MTSSVLEKYYHLGAVRIKAVKLLAERGITHRMSEKEIAQEVGVSAETLTKWKSDPQFNKALLEYAKEISRSSMTKVLARLNSEIDTSSTRDFINLARLIMQYHGELTDKSEVTIKDEGKTVDDILNELTKYTGLNPDDFKEK